MCKVVDNFGDIGVAYRLAKSLCELDSTLNITIVCSNLVSFSKLAEFVAPEKKIQTVRFGRVNWTVLDWKQDEDSLAELKNSALPVSDFSFPVILECFQCGRPEWLESILGKSGRAHHILNVEYLTGEDYAEEFHLLKSYSRNPYIKKRFFMPGFTDKTGGLLWDSAFLAAVKKSSKSADLFKISIFSYERDFSLILKRIEAFQTKMRAKNKSFSVEILAAAGKSQLFVKSAWENTEKKVRLTLLPFLPQEEYDRILSDCDVNFVRGEETLARACLCGKPFVWHAYVQDDNYQLVKVGAFLNHLKHHFDEASFSKLKTLFESYNTPGAKIDSSLLDDFLMSSTEEKFKNPFGEFSKRLFANGNLSEHILNCLGGLNFN